MSSLRAMERETVISRADDEDFWHVYSASRPMMRKLERIAGRLHIAVTHAADGLSLEVELPIKALSLRAPRKLTEDQRVAAGERLQDARVASKSLVGSEF